MRSEPAAIRLALPSKGHLHDGAVEILKAAGYKVKRPSDRQYEATIAGRPRFHVVLMRPADIVAQVQEGRCALGVTGMDVYAEHKGEAPDTCAIIDDLGYAGCRLVVAVPESWIDVTHALDLVDLTNDFKAAGRTLRVSTKYANLVRAYFRARGIHHYQLIASDGALELHPSLGIADIIVDLTSSGSTLKENRLREVAGGTVLESTACLIGHVPTLQALLAEGSEGPLALLLDALDAVRSAESRLFLEVVGEGAVSSVEIAAWLVERGVRHVVRGEAHDARDRQGWRISGLATPKDFPALKRGLFRAGATRITGLPPRFVFDRDDPSTWDELRDRIGGNGR